MDSFLLEFLADIRKVLRRYEMTNSFPPSGNGDSHIKALAKLNKYRVLLLQGPVGGFFQHLQETMVTKGMDVKRLTFNGGDVFFARNSNHDVVRNVGEMFAFFDRTMAEYQPDVVVLFGDERPIHRAAIKAATQRGIPVWCFEEGYVRPNYVTLEQYGNNANSKLAESFVSSKRQRIPEIPPAISGLTFSMAAAAIVYFAAYRLSRHLFAGYIHHRERRLHKELWYWLRGIARRLCARQKDAALVQQLMTDEFSNFYMVALQVHDDLQLVRHGLGWRLTPFIEMVVRSFARTAPVDTQLVIKAHPLDLGYGDHRRLLKRLIVQHGMEGRIHFLSSGTLGPILRKSKGLVTINSTAGLVSLSNGVPTVVFGKALYQVEGLIDRPSTETDLDRFWKCPGTVDRELASAFYRHIINTALLPGSFYVKHTWPRLSEQVCDRLVTSVSKEQVQQKIVQSPLRPNVGIISRGIWRSREMVEHLLDAHAVRLRPWTADTCEMIAGWGLKPTSEKARLLAVRTGCQYIALEDGFLRSVKPGPRQRSISMIADRTGVYYDATRTSDLEKAVLSRIGVDSNDLYRIKTILKNVRDQRLSKYNHAPMMSAAALGVPRSRDIVLVIDQTLGDASIIGAGANQSTFTAMLTAAIDENPGRTIVVKSHPQSAVKGGNLIGNCYGRNIIVVDTNVNPWSLLEMAAKVYVVSSQIGMEAALAGIPVTCFGQAAYAGWGFTDDRFDPIARRTNASTNEFAAAAYLDYCHWFDLYKGTLVEIETAIDQLTFVREKYFSNPKSICVGFSSWKQKTVMPFLDGINGPPEFVATVPDAVKKRSDLQTRIIVWGDQHSAALRDLKIRATRAEDGFLRSVGLGASFVAPASLVFDSLGLYYDPRGWSDLDAIAQTATFTPALIERAKRIRKTIIENGLSKYNDGTSTSLRIDSKRVRILVVGQVEDDSSIQLGSPHIKTNLALLKRVRERWPKGYIIFKPHPDVHAGFRAGRVPENIALKFADLVVTDVGMPSLLQHVDRLETMTSLAGFEAILRGIPVTTHGTPFYSGWGLTEDLAPSPRRTRKLTIDELTAVALINYPSYVDPVTGLPCEVETILDRLSTQKAVAGTLHGRVRTWLRHKVAWVPHNSWGAVRRYFRAKRLARNASNMPTLSKPPMARRFTH